MPKYINISEVLEDMVLAESISNKFGQVLCKQGSKVNGKLLKMFKTWGVKGILIRDEDEEENQINPKLKKELTEKIEKELDFKPFTEIEKNLLESLIIYNTKYSKIETK